MRNNRFQNHISESSFTLPLCMVMGTLVWFWNGTSLDYEFENSALWTLFLAIGVTYVVFETANTYALLRIRSRMITSVWVVLISMMAFVHFYHSGWIAALAMAGSYYVMFATYQEHEPVLGVFHTFFLLSVAILALPQLCILVPLYYWYLLVFLRCLSWRCFWAGLVGLSLPLCLVLGWCVITADYSFAEERIDNLLQTVIFPVERYKVLFSLTSVEALDFLLVSMLSLIGIIHYLHNYYNDKIRTRMYLYIYVMQTIASWLIVICAPDMWHLMAPALLLNASTMIAHFFALTGSIISNLFFCMTLAILFLMYIINLGLWIL